VNSSSTFLFDEFADEGTPACKCNGYGVTLTKTGAQIDDLRAMPASTRSRARLGAAQWMFTRPRSRPRQPVRRRETPSARAPALLGGKRP
jgi:hypothetical protein